ncbi:MAG: 1-acyl-sn-glycerol-3-phosphate acyltransferase [Fimbriimonadaceae bacterium]|nr:1-acyl-sn-glycerol-3-phosphate acyltransferase [Fimbriimonadaceae bacterium]
MATDLVPGSRFYERWFLPVGRFVFAPLFWLLGPIRVKGAALVPKTGGLLIVANHRSDFDPIAVQYACPRAMHYMSKRELFDIRVLGPLIRHLNCFPVERDSADRGALKFAIKLLEAGEAVTVFPEGRISESGELLPLKSGVALIARSTGSPVICCGLRGTERIVPYGSVLPRPSWGRARVTWGEPRRFAKHDEAEAIMGWIEHELRTLGVPHDE